MSATKKLTMSEIIRNQHNTGLAGLEIRGVKLDNVVEYAFYNGQLIVIEYDDLRENPRKDYDPFGNMYCWARNYNLTDDGIGEYSLYYALSNHTTRNIEDEYIDDSRGREIRNKNYIDDDDVDAVLTAAEKIGFVVLNLYLYDHSGITMRTSPFSCPWDSGRVGYIYATPEECEEFMPAGWETRSKQVQGKMRKSARAKMAEALNAAVEVFDRYLTGAVYSWAAYDFTVKYDAMNDENCVDVDCVPNDSCCGYYDEPEYVMVEAIAHTGHRGRLPALAAPYTLPIPMKAVA